MAYRGKKKVFPKRVSDLDYEKDIVPVHELLLSEEYGFENYEIKHIVNYKPTLFLIEDEYKTHRGIKALKELMM